MTTEDDFQNQLDQCPEDHNTRLVFADWLDERNDPRGPGYRALGMCRVYPHKNTFTGKSFVYHNGKGHYGSPDKPMPICHRIPSQRWLDLIQDEEYKKSGEKDEKMKVPEDYKTKGTVLSSCLAETRRWLEDCAALAFLKLDPIEQAAMLSGNAQGES